MTLLQAAAARQLKHRRPIDVQVYARGDAPWEVHAVLVDTQTRVAHMAEVSDTHGTTDGASPPFQSDRCHTQRGESPVVQQRNRITRAGSSQCRPRDPFRLNEREKEPTR